MSIPLDRLYNFLHDVCNHDVIIYRYFPHGSKNISDCSALTPGTWVDNMTLPCAWHHDQECLDIKRISLNQRWFKVAGKFFKPSSHYTWFKNQTLVPYQFYNKVILVHSELNSPVVEELENHGYIPVHWFSHAAIARDWYRYAEHDTLLEHTKRQFAHRFLIYNRAWSGSREYRIAFAEQLIKHDLVSQCKTSFGFVDNDLHYSKHVFKNPAWKSSTILEDYFDSNTYSPTSSADYDSQDYKSAAIEVVLETIFDDARNHITEKTFRAIATGTPFILAASAGSLEYLKRYGFETFAPVICEDYDQETDPVQRMSLIINEMSRLAQLNDQEFADAMAQCFAIAQRNKTRFFSKEFMNQVFDEYRQGMTQAIAECKKDINLENWLLYADHAAPHEDIEPVFKYFNLA